MKKPQILYVLGAGRSGTTLLGTMLHDSALFHTAGELHQILDYIDDNLECSCGKKIINCEFWGKFVNSLSLENNLKYLAHLTRKQERHFLIPCAFMGKITNEDYHDLNSRVFRHLSNIVEDKWIVDTSKYITRFWNLKNNPDLKVKGIYMVRDVRGVIHSFKKKVQTPKSPFKSLIYYWLTNLGGYLSYIMSTDVMKMKYEDLLIDTSLSLNHIYRLIDYKAQNIEIVTAVFNIPHIIGGNRLKHKRTTEIILDDAWKREMPRFEQYVYYILCLPIMLINGYRI